MLKTTELIFNDIDEDGDMAITENEHLPIFVFTFTTRSNITT
jgi:hypothetical protein